jgi:DNA-binding NtrC family response regulator
MSKPKVLYGELNEQVLSEQADALKKAGYEVTTAVGRKGVQDGLKQGSFDLVVLGPTLSREDRHHLPYMVKKAQATACVVVMHTDGSRHPYVDGNVDTGSDMEHWLRKIQAMAPAKAKAASAGK